jgi:hypothetical protein
MRDLVSNFGGSVEPEGPILALSHPCHINKDAARMGRPEAHTLHQLGVEHDFRVVGEPSVSVHSRQKHKQRRDAQGHNWCPADTAPRRLDTMFEKQGKFYADWRNDTGKRIRKSFNSKRAALQFEAEQKGRSHPKKKARGNQSAISCAPGTKHPAREVTSRQSHAGSPKLLAMPSPKTSARRTLKK